MKWQQLQQKMDARLKAGESYTEVYARYLEIFPSRGSEIASTLGDLSSAAQREQYGRQWQVMVGALAIGIVASLGFELLAAIEGYWSVVAYFCPMPFVEAFILWGVWRWRATFFKAGLYSSLACSLFFAIAYSEDLLPWLALPVILVQLPITLIGSRLYDKLGAKWRVVSMEREQRPDGTVWTHPQIEFDN